MVKNRIEVANAFTDYCNEYNRNNENKIGFSKEKTINIAISIIDVMHKKFICSLSEELIIKLYMVEDSTQMGQFLKTFFENYEFTENEGYKLEEIQNEK